MYDTYGFPYELTEEIAEERGIKVSKKEFEEKWMNKEKARSAREIIMEKGQDTFIEEFYDKYGVTEFTGYKKIEDTGKLLSVREAKKINIYSFLIKHLLWEIRWTSWR